MLGLKLHSGTFKTKARQGELVRVAATTVQPASQPVWFCTMWPDRAKGLFITIIWSTWVVKTRTELEQRWRRVKMLHICLAKWFVKTLKQKVWSNNFNLNRFVMKRKNTTEITLFMQEDSKLITKCWNGYVVISCIRLSPCAHSICA